MTDAPPVTPPEAPANAPAAPPAPEAPAPTAQPAETDWKAEARKWEQRAKDNKAKLDEAAPKLKEFDAQAEANKTELQRAQDAREAAEARATATMQQVAIAEVKAALTGVVPDPAAVVEDLNMGRFVTAEGQVDAEAVAALKAKYTALAPASRLPAPNPAQGAGSAGAPVAGQMTRDEVERLGREGKFAEIDKAREEGRLSQILGTT